MDIENIDLPLLPEVASHVLQVCARDGDVHEIASAIKHSPEMAAHVLKWANSSLYRPRTAIVSLQQAIARLGIRNVRDIALIVTCKTRIFRAPGFDAELRFVFRHSLATALFAQEIARLKRTNVEEAFLCGLLHHIGRPLMFQAIVDLRQKKGIVAPRADAFVTVDALHARSGAMLARKWQMSEAIATAIEQHHDPLEAREYTWQACTVRLAADLAHHTVEPQNVPALEMHPMLSALSIYPDQLQSLIAKRDWVLSTLAELP